MDIKTCEEYVLQELQTWQDKALSLETENKRILDKASKEIKELTDAIKFADNAINVFKQLLTLERAAGEDDKLWNIKSKGDVTISTAGETGRNIFILLAGFIGDEEAMKEFEKMKAGAEDKETAEEKEEE